MTNCIAEPLSRKNIRDIAFQLRNLLGINDAEYIDIVFLLDVLSQKLKGFSYEIIGNNALPKKVYATTNAITGHIKIKKYIYNNACDGDGFARFTIAHEIGHFILMYLCGLQTAKAAKDAKVKSYEDPEWQADCFAGEFLMGYNVVKNYSVKQLIERCVVSKSAAKCQFDKFNNIRRCLCKI